MLVVTRRPGENIVIGTDRQLVTEQGVITVAVLEVNGMRVRVGVNAPKDVLIHREEIYHKFMKERGYEPIDVDASTIEKEIRLLEQLTAAKNGGR